MKTRGTDLTAEAIYEETLEPDTLGIECCFDEEAQRMLDDFRKKGLGDTAEEILAILKARGVAGMTSLELGCGVGALTLKLLKEGVTSAVGIDLSPKMVAAARSLATEEGLSLSASFEVGDGAKNQLSASDVVILDAVLCCYPDFHALVENSSAAARRYYAISLPDERRLATRLLRLFLPLQSVFFRRGTFRFFVHPIREIAAELERNGFTMVSDSTVGWIWSALIFEAPSSR